MEAFLLACKIGTNTIETSFDGVSNWKQSIWVEHQCQYSGTEKIIKLLYTIRSFKLKIVVWCLRELLQCAYPQSEMRLFFFHASLHLPRSLIRSYAMTVGEQREIKRPRAPALGCVVCPGCMRRHSQARGWWQWDHGKDGLCFCCCGGSWRGACRTTTSGWLTNVLSLQKDADHNCSDRTTGFPQDSCQLRLENLSSTHDDTNESLCPPAQSCVKPVQFLDGIHNHCHEHVGEMITSRQPFKTIFQLYHHSWKWLPACPSATIMHF